jgi:hypothetical protein
MTGCQLGSAILSIIGCGLFASVVTAQTTQTLTESKFDTFGWGFEFKYSFPGYQGRSVEEVSGLSDEVRTVLIHPDDYRAGTPLLFGDQKLRIINPDAPFRGFGLMDWEFMPVLKIWKFKPKFGIVVSARVVKDTPEAPGTLELSKDFPEITYQGSLRDVGAALVYMTAVSPTETTWGTVKELEIEITKSNAFLVGSKNRHYDINIESGWDRYGSLEVYRTYKLGRMDIQQIYLGWSYLPAPEDADIGFHFIGGRSISTFKAGTTTSTLGEISNPWFFELALSARAKFW